MSAQEKTKNKKEDATINQSDNQELDSLLSALEGDLTALDSEAALSLIEQWHDSLHKAKEPEIKEIAKNLKHLKQLVKSGKATGHEVGEILIEIGEQTSELTSDADKDVKTQLQKLGKQLTKVGLSLGKAEDREQIEDINSLVETLEGDLTKIDSDAAIGAIDQWYTALHKSEDENLKEIADGLKQLKQLLKRAKAKPADFALLLIKLGEQTTEAASVAPRGFKSPIQKLGKLLSKTGKSLEE